MKCELFHSRNSAGGRSVLATEVRADKVYQVFTVCNSTFLFTVYQLLQKKDHQMLKTHHQRFVLLFVPIYDNFITENKI